MTPILRLAGPADEPAIAQLCQASARELFPSFYDAEQNPSAVKYFAVLDRTLIDDGTYYVHDADGEVVACGGWSRRNKLFTGSGAGDDTRLLDPASEPARIRAMFVRADWTRRGLARAILQRSMDAAPAEGFGSVILSATLPGVPFYESLGFTVAEQAVDTLPDGVQVPSARMTRSIEV
jgi:GNAT superfamily N-acetyltransferase